MNLTISGHHVEVTPAMREYVLMKFERVWAHFDKVVEVDIILSVEKLSEKQRCQKIKVKACYKDKPIVVEQCDADLYTAIDKAADKLDRQVVRHKTRVQDHRHVAPKRVSAAMA